MDQPVIKASVDTGAPHHNDGELVHAIWAGPLPSPAILRQYEAMHPGMAERIINAFEVENRHRQGLETTLVGAEIRRDERDSNERRRGQYLAFVLCLAAIVGGTYVGSHGQQIVGSIIGGTGLAGLAAAFIYGRAATAKKDRS